MKVRLLFNTKLLSFQYINLYNVWKQRRRKVRHVHIFYWSFFNLESSYNIFCLLRFSYNFFSDVIINHLRVEILICKSYETQNLCANFWLRIYAPLHIKRRILYYRNLRSWICDLIPLTLTFNCLKFTSSEWKFYNIPETFPG